MPRRKAPAIDAPQTLADAIGLLESYAEITFALETLATDRDAAIAAIRAAHDAAAAPLELHLKASFNRLKPWWEVARDALTSGKKKSVELGGCVIGLRTNTPSLQLPKGATAESLIAGLIAWKLRQFVVVKRSLDRAGLIKWLRGPENSIRAELIRLGLDIKQADEFFIDRIPPKTTATISQGETA
jgi:phage host-nuclease inhibitor protein Gam